MLTTPKKERISTSKYFAAVTPSPVKKPKPAKSPRPPRGTVSALPFPRLSAPRFGLIQEELADDPFRLLVAVTFLIRTAGRTAVPAFRALIDRYPTPEALVAAPAADMIDMIRHLGLAVNRTNQIKKYARLWIEDPPRAGVVHAVRNYPLPATPLGIAGVEDDKGISVPESGVPEPELLGVQPTEAAGDDDDDSQKKEDGDADEEEGKEDTELREEQYPDPNTSPALPSTGKTKTASKKSPKTGIKRKRTAMSTSTSAWEIGHLTQGPYAIDSWRIFCRDVLLGRSSDWCGREAQLEAEPGSEGAAEAPGPDFEPEWKRVLPQDKELRACLRWMWMREGWDWDPRTGVRKPLPEELRRAVEEGRVGWDNTGMLQIVKDDEEEREGKESK